GPLDSALHGLVDTSRLPEDIHEPAGRFAEIVNKRLAFNPVKDIFIYVHGVNRSFEYPLLVASELWHYMGYRGVFIAFSWPSGQNIMEYVTDVDTAEYSAVQLRRFLEYLISETEAERIHILAFSAGTKLVTLSLHQIGLMELCNEDENPESTRIGRVLFAAGDVERQLFGMYVSDKLLEPIDSLTVYMSSSDKALNASRSIRRYPRLGQPWASEDISPEALSYIKNSGKLEFIDVSGQEGVQEGAGHEYFRSSPWVSSDILANLALGVSPDKRGLVLQENQVYWSFPEDYIERLSLALEQLKFEKSLMQIPSP
ncbi:MAG: alpha/beta hydrolase, partial [Spirochaetaceae bacterium]|nr:alpha/beta hydrolase [Spirochaetaceae bacterium]